MTNATFKEKWENYWYYYKNHTILGIVIILFSIPLIANSFGQKQTILDVALLGVPLTADQQNKLEQLSSAAFVPPDKIKQQEVSLDLLPFDASTQMVTEQKIMAETAVQSLDVLVVPKSEFLKYAHSGMFQNLSTNKSYLQMGQLGDTFLTTKTKEDSNSEPYGIIIQSGKLKMVSNPKDPLVIGIPTNTKRNELATRFALWLLRS